MSQSETRRVRIVGDHPHQGVVGTLVLDADRMAQGMLPVEFDDEYLGHHGANACYVRPEDIQTIEEGADVYRRPKRRR